MLSRLRARLTYANVISSLALFLVVSGGTAYAVNTIGSSDVIDESLLSQDIKNREVGTNDLAIGSVFGSRIRDNAILSSHVVNNTLTGDDIDETTLKTNVTTGTKNLPTPQPASTSLFSVDVPFGGAAGGSVDYTVVAKSTGSTYAAERGTIDWIARNDQIVCNTRDKLLTGVDLATSCQTGTFEPGAQPGISLQDNVPGGNLTTNKVHFTIRNDSPYSIRLE